jgi:DNA-binding CsgD family transcriptional regulator
MHGAGGPDAAARLLVMAQAGPLDEPGRARAEQLRARTAARPDRSLLLLKAADHLELVDAGLAREAYRDAFGAAVSTGRLAGRGGLRRVAEAVLTAPPAPPSEATAGLLGALATLVTEGYATGGPAVRQALRASHRQGWPGQDAVDWLLFASRLSQFVWDDATWDALATRLIAGARRAGALAVLPAALAESVAFQLAAGDLTTAASMAREAERVARATGGPAASWSSALVAAWLGQEAETGRLVAAARQGAGREDGYALTACAWATAVLHNGLGRYEEALAAAGQASEDPDELGLAVWSLAELIEAAARTGSPERAAGAMRRLTEAASGAATDWALGVQARSQALLSEGGLAERLYLEAIQRLGRTRVRAELGRAYLLYGEWLRRQGRRRDAREQLRRAHQMLDEMGLAAFAERARRELVATGEVVRKRAIGTVHELTPQETQIAWLAVNGHSNPEIGTQLFLSPRTVEWHLRKVFEKLGIGSRKEIRTAMPGLERVSRSALTRGRAMELPGQHPVELAAGTDAELGEHLAQVVLDRPGADEQARADLRVGQALHGQPGDLGLLGGQRSGRRRIRGGSPANGLARGQQLTAGPVGERR